MRELCLSLDNESRYPIDVHRDFARVLDPNHIHDFLQIFYVNGGSYTHYLENASLTLHSNAVAIIPSWCPHYADARHAENDLFFCNLTARLFQTPTDDPWSFFQICLKPLDSTAYRKTPFLIPRVQTGGEISRLYHELHIEAEKHDAELLPLLRGKIVELMSLIAAEYSACESRLYGSALSDYCPSIYTAFCYIHQNYRRELHAEEVAHIAMMSERSFYRIFKGCMGMSFLQYVQYLRILHAKRLLENTERILPDIASEAGFPDLANFHRAFRQKTGLTPREYRSSIEIKH